MARAFEISGGRVFDERFFNGLLDKGLVMFMIKLSREEFRLRQSCWVNNFDHVNNHVA